MANLTTKTAVDRRERMLDAAQALFLENGLRGTTMEAIARRAGTAKPTLYNYFPDKEAVFAAVIERFIEEMKAMASEELDRPGAADKRIAAALTKKLTAVFHLLENSPHAQDLMTDKVMYAGEAFADLDKWSKERVTAVLTGAGYDEPEKKARLILACADGIHRAAERAEDIGVQIGFVTQRLLND